MKTITTLTMNPCVDISADINRVEPIKKMRCSRPRREPGGGGINVARGIHKLGGGATAYFTCGGVTGDFLLELLDLEGIDNHPLRVSGITRENVAVLETDTGRQYRFVLPGEELQQKDWQQCLALLESLEPRPDYLVVSGSLPPGVPADFYARLINLLRGTGTEIILDTSGDALRGALEARVYMIKPNLRELGQAAGSSLEDRREQEEFCRKLVAEKKCEIVVLSMGHKGALLTDREIQIRLPAMDVEVESSIGAGDSMVAGMVISLARGLDHESSFYYGMAAGTAAVITPGGELCRREDTEQFYRRLRDRRQR